MINSRCDLSRMHCQYDRIVVLALELGSHVSQRLIQCRFGRSVCRESANSCEQGSMLAKDSTYPSSISRKFCADPESLDMKTIVPMGMFVWSNLWAQIMGPIVLVCK